MFKKFEKCSLGCCLILVRGENMESATPLPKLSHCRYLKVQLYIKYIIYILVLLVIRALPSGVGERCARRARKRHHQAPKVPILDHFDFEHFLIFFKSGLRRVQKRMPGSLSAPLT